MDLDEIGGTVLNTDGDIFFQTSPANPKMCSLSRNTQRESLRRCRCFTKLAFRPVEYVVEHRELVVVGKARNSYLLSDKDGAGSQYANEGAKNNDEKTKS